MNHPFLRSLLLLFSVVLGTLGRAQDPTATGNITGIVVDEKTKETIIGAVVKVEGTELGTVTDVDGRFLLRNVPVGAVNVRIGMLPYVTKVVQDVQVSAGRTTELNALLQEATTELKEFVVSAQANRGSAGTLMNALRENDAIAVGVSQEQIKRSPDSNVGEVLKRASGISVQDNKFVIVRGLADRYNTGMVNGTPVSSTEPDRKAIGFDLFPSGMVDNVVVTKTATPDMPGEFAGGIVQINTKEVPEKNFINVSAGTGLNTQSTFESYSFYPKGGTDALGFDDGTRALPDGLPPDRRAFQQLPLQERGELSRLFPTTFQIDSATAPLNTAFQLSGAKRAKMGEKGSLGLLGSLTYNRTVRTVNVERNNFNAVVPSQEESARDTLFGFRDVQHNDEVSVGALLNFGARFNDKSSLGFKNLFSVNGQDRTTFRRGIDNAASGVQIRSNAGEYTGTMNLSSQLYFKHVGPKGHKANAGMALGRVTREMPDLRRIYYNATTSSPSDTTFYLTLPNGSATTNSAGRFYSDLTDATLTAHADYRTPLFGSAHFLKVGALWTRKERSFSARVLGYVYPFGSNPVVDQLLYTPNVAQEDVLTEANIGPGSIRVDDITGGNDGYTADQTVQAGFIMLENPITPNLKAIWGIRYETFDQVLNTAEKFTFLPQEYLYDTATALPSLNLIWNAHEKHVVRAAVARTVARPEVRDLAPNAFYDFTTASVIQGSPGLRSGAIDNFDLRYEFYPRSGQFISFSAFYKEFEDPIEQVWIPASGGPQYGFRNQENGAYDMGVELELRIRASTLPMAREGGLLDRFTIFANAALIKSEVDLTGQVNTWDLKRPMQGQSPYLLNAGVDFRDPDLGIGIALLYNRVGDRIAFLGDKNNPDVVERGRDLLDAQLTKTFLNKKAELKLAANDVLNQALVLYQDLGRDDRYDEGTDSVIQSSVFGSNYSVSVSYTF
jgi:Outer membrane protein beta-barrel family/CarboxypepD_reg-like domain/TonB-dependent Receptor Plug Domain